MSENVLFIQNFHIIDQVFIAFKPMEEKTLRYGTISSIILMICFSFLKGVNSEIITVGDGEGWNSEVDYVSWSQKYNFSVGDVLEFKYDRGQHNAFEVTEATYRSCDTSSGVIAKYETGDDRVMLNESRNYWFVCNVNGHCLGGMRFGIDIKARNNSPNTTLQPTPSVNSCSIFVLWSLSRYFFTSAVLIQLLLIPKLF